MEVSVPQPKIVPEWRRGEVIEINRLSYKVSEESAKTVKAMLKGSGKVKSAKIIQVGGMTGMLVSLTSWKMLALFLEWIPHHELTKQLIPALRITCGSIEMGTPAREQAKRIIAQKASEQFSTPDEADQDSEPEDPSAREYRSSVRYHSHGVYCEICTYFHHCDSAVL